MLSSNAANGGGGDDDDDDDADAEDDADVQATLEEMRLQLLQEWGLQSVAKEKKSKAVAAASLMELAEQGPSAFYDKDGVADAEQAAVDRRPAGGLAPGSRNSQTARQPRRQRWNLLR